MTLHRKTYRRPLKTLEGYEIDSAEKNVIFMVCNIQVNTH